METETKTKIDVKKVTITALLVLLTAGVVGGGVYYILNQNFQKEREANEKALNDARDQLKKANETKKDTSTTSTTPSSATASVDDWHVYKNSAYGFQLTFPESWKGYKFFEKKVDGITKTWYVELPTTDPNYAAASSTAEAGYASIFAISAYTASEWADEQQNPAPAAETGKVGNYTFGYSMSQASPTDISSARRSEVKSIVQTFKGL